MLVETLVTQRSPSYSAVSSLLTNSLPDCSNYSPFCHTHYLTPDQYFTSLFGPDPLLNCSKETNTSLLQRFTAESSRELRRTQSLEEAEQQGEAMSMFLILLFKLLTQFPFVSFLYNLYPLSAPFLNPLSSPSPPTSEGSHDVLPV